MFIIFIHTAIGYSRNRKRINVRLMRLISPSLLFSSGKPLNLEAAHITTRHLPGLCGCGIRCQGNTHDRPFGVVFNSAGEPALRSLAWPSAPYLPQRFWLGCDFPSTGVVCCSADLLPQPCYAASEDRLLSTGSLLQISAAQART